MSHRKRKLFPRNLKHDPDRVLDGMLVLECFFCGRYKTPIEFDMKNHLLELHKGKLISALPISGKGYDIDYRIEFAIDIMKRKKPIEFYDHRDTQQELEENGIDSSTKQDDNRCSQSVGATNRVSEASLVVDSDGFKDLSIKLNQIYREDCLKFMDRLREQNMHVDVIVTSPPYNVGKEYSGTSYNDNTSENEYLNFMFQVAKSAFSILQSDGSFFLNIGARPSNQYLPIEVARKFKEAGFKLQNTICWIKSIVIDEDEVGKDTKKNNIDFKDQNTISVGHFKPVNSSRFVTGIHESVYHFTKCGVTDLDKMAIGVEHQDKSNVERWARNGKKRDKRDRGDVWFMTYKTIQKHRSHPAEFPIKIPEMCIKLHGAKPDILVYDPFMGSGNTALASISLGVSFVGTEISKEYVEMAEENIRNFTHSDKVSDDSGRERPHACCSKKWYER